MTTVLLLARAPARHDGIRRALEDAGFDTRLATDLRDALRLGTPRLLLLVGISAPDAVAEVLRALRPDGQLPVLLYDDRLTPDQRAALLDRGVDGILDTPLTARLLVARVRAMLRTARTPASRPAGSPLRAGPIEIDIDRRDARIGRRVLHLTVTEWDILVALARRAGRIVTRQELAALVWGGATSRAPQVLRVHIAHLRRKLGPAAALLQTERGIGFRLAEAAPAGACAGALREGAP